MITDPALYLTLTGYFNKVMLDPMYYILIYSLTHLCMWDAGLFVLVFNVLINTCCFIQMCSIFATSQILLRISSRITSRVLHAQTNKQTPYCFLFCQAAAQAEGYRKCTCNVCNKREREREVRVNKRGHRNEIMQKKKICRIHHKPEMEFQLQHN